MADEGEIDVLGDFDLKLEADGNIDDNELPSKSANLLPEYTDPPWLLEQGWTLDNSCMDEKSKATIEKMLLEEQYYISGKSPRGKKQLAVCVNHGKGLEKMPGGVGIGPKKTEHKKLVWTREEKDMFHRGMEIYGRSWTKIAELIPTRTSTQIKNFAHQLFRSLGKDSKDNESPSSITDVYSLPASMSSSSIMRNQDPLTMTMAAVSTASPTVKTVKKSAPKRGRIPTREKLALQTLPMKNVAFKKSFKHKVKGKGGDELHSLSKQDMVSNKQSTERHLSDLVLDNKLTITPTLIENLDGFCAVADIINGENTEACKSDESDEDINVDIENDDDSDSNPLLIGRSTSPNSVYEKLLIEANLNETNETDTNVYSEEDIDKGGGITNFLEWKTCESQKVMNKVQQINGDIETESGDSCSSKEEAKEFDSKEMTEEGRIEEQTGDLNSDVGRELKTSNDLDKVPVQTKVEITKQIDSQKVLVNALLREDCEVVHFPVPTSEVTLPPKIITEQEKEVLKEFFENRPSKTPERYLKIRNYIIESWKKCSPSYLNKTSIRSGLKNCGDVNSIGRVHAFLECIGAINFGCEQSAYKHPRSIYSLLGREKVNKDFPPEVNSAKLEAMRPRKRKVKDAFGVWIDEKELEGMTFEHGKVDENQPKESKPKQSKTAYDPFKLIPCLSFSDDNMQAPFLVEIHCSALIVMDIHSHISKTEVIGMLGGKFFEEQGKLTITMATPCNSISTGMQCEMDPVSQTQASEEIRGSGMDVVGWYHSHPSFAPNPSVRDIETQLKFQDWFSKGGSKFVGVIISPYNPRNTTMCSEVNCLTVSKEVLPQLQCNIPYKFNYTTKPCDISEVNHIMLTTQDLATSYSNYANRVDLVSTYSSSRGISCLDKMLESLKTYCPGEDIEHLLKTVRKTFTPVAAADPAVILNST